MSYIYCIRNTITNEKYIGVTRRQIEKRWKEHLREAKKDRAKNRPLYNAINTYGDSSFEMSIIEECDENKAFDREEYWIETLGTFIDGYNMTFGGAGKKYVDYDKIVIVYSQTNDVEETAKILGYCKDVVYDALKMNGIKPQTPQDAMKLKRGVPVVMYTETNEYVMRFNTLHEASLYLIANGNGRGKKIDSTNYRSISMHIKSVCEGKRKKAYGYIWRYGNKVMQRDGEVSISPVS